jgi:NitT/TauT family transport system substrate-binding protein
MKRLMIGLALSLAMVYSSGASALEKVDFRLDWVPGAEFAPFYLGKEKGFFAEQGIDINILPGQGSTVTAKLVGNRSTPFGLASSDVVLISNSKDLPLTSIGVVYQQLPGGVVFRTSSGIKTLTDLYGKKLGIQYKSSTEKQWRAVAKEQHIDESKITELPADGAVAQLIASNQIDAGIAFYFNDGLKLVSEGIPMSSISFYDAGLKFYADALIVNPALIKENPDLVKRFTKAFVKSWTYGLAHQDEALASFLKQNPTVDAKYSAMKLPVAMKMASSPDTEANGFGHSTKEEWESMQKQLVQMGLITTPIDVTKMFTNDFLK